MPIDLISGDNTIDLGFMTHSFTAVSGDNYIYLPGLGFGAKDIRSISDEDGRVYEANKINTFLYIIPGIGTGKQVTVDYTANVDSQSLTIIDNIDDSVMTVNSAVTLLPDTAGELVGEEFANGDVFTAYVDNADGKLKFAIYSETEIKTGTIYDNQASSIAVTKLDNDNMMVAFRNGVTAAGQIVTVSQAGIVSDASTFNSGSTDNINLTTTYNDSVVIAFEDKGNNNYGTVVEVDYQGNIITPEVVFNSLATSSIDVIRMLNGNMMVAYADVAGKVSILDNSLTSTLTQTFKNFAPTSIDITMLGNGNNMIAYIDGADSSANFVIYDQEGIGVVGETIISAAATTDLDISMLSSGQVLATYIAGGISKALLINNDGTIQIAATNINTASISAIAGQNIIYNNTGINLKSILPFATSSAVSFDKINKIIFNYENYGIASEDVEDKLVDADAQGNDNNGDVAENMTVRELTKDDVSSILDMTVAEANVYEYDNCIDGICSYEGLPAAGDIVVSDYNGEVMTVKSIKKNATNIVGVVTTDPAVILKKNLEGRTIVLTGTTPIKVSLENGTIQKGDLLTTSSTPGVAMKATSRTAGTLGVALNAFDPINTCKQDMSAIYREELEASDISYTEEEMELLISTLDLSICEEDIIEFGQISVLISINNPVVTDTGSIITIIDASEQETVIDLSIMEYEEFGNVVVKGETIFGGKITVAKAEFLGNIVVAGSIKVKGNLELSGAITQNYWDGSNSAIEIGDAVAIIGSDTVGQTWASNGNFLPAIGLAVEILDYDYIPEDELNAYISGMGYDLETGAPIEIRDSIRLIKVASSGKVGGFTNLSAGATYYLADKPGDIDTLTVSDSLNDLLLESAQLEAELAEQEVAIAKALDEGNNLALQRSLSAIPSINGAQQVLGIAKSKNELIIMPSLSYGGEIITNTAEESSTYVSSPSYSTPTAGSGIVEEIDEFIASQPEEVIEEEVVVEEIIADEIEVEMIEDTTESIDIEVIIGEAIPEIETIEEVVETVAVESTLE